MRSATARVVLALAAGGCLSSPPGSLESDGGPAGDAVAEVDSASPIDCGDLAPLAPFADDFENDALAWAVEPKPTRAGTGAIEMTVQGGELVFQPRAAGNDYAWLQSPPFDFTSGRIAVRITGLTTDAGSQPYLGVIGPGAEEMMFRFDGSQLAAPGGVSVPYLSAVHVWWQVASEAGVLHFQTSVDGITWEPFDQVAPKFEVDAVLFEVGINVDDAGPAERGLFAVDDLDLPPC